MTTAARMNVVVAVATPQGQGVTCARCGGTIAEWDGERIIVQRSKTGVYIEIPGNRAVIQCPHSIRVSTGWQPCMYVNRVQLPVA